MKNKMKPKLLALSLFATTAIGIAIFPSMQQAQAITTLAAPVVTTIPLTQKHRIEVVFVLDTTSSMSGLIQAAKEKIWSIATTMASANQAPDIKMGLVAFRDRGDDYVTKVLDLSNDLDSMYAQLTDFKAQGGGDGPESVNQALHEAITNVSWSKDSNVYRVAFLIGDAPPHMDYPNDVKYPATLALAKKNGIVVNTIQSGQNSSATPAWQNIAALGNGEYFQVENSGNAVAVNTPFDQKLSELSASLESTRLYFGNEADKKIQKNKLDASNKLHDELSVAALARRATYNATTSGKANFLGKGELVEAVTSGEISLDEIEAEQMPESMQAMAPEEQLAVIEKQFKKRNQIKQEIAKLSQSRSQFIKEKVVELGGVEDSLDAKIYSAVKEQAKSIGLAYESKDASY
jgi:Mg-chelatase subunit ChlD